MSLISDKDLQSFELLKTKIKTNLADVSETSSLFLNPTQLSLDPFTNLHFPLLNLILFSPESRESRASHLVVFFRHLTAKAQALHLLALRLSRLCGLHLRFLFLLVVVSVTVTALLLPQAAAGTRAVQFLCGITVGLFW